MGAFDRLIEQIDAFIKKYYKNQLVKGLILFMVFSLLSFLLVNVLEYFGRFNTVVRAILFFGALAFIIYSFTLYFLIPLAKLFSFGRRINREQASKIIGDFFPNVKDSLLNTLQLHNSVNQESKQYDLLLASVEQKSQKLSAVPFSTAVDLGENKKYLKFVVPLFLIVLSIAVFAPSFFKDGTERLVNYNKEYIEPAPFEFKLTSKSLKVEEGESLEIGLELISKNDEPLPNKVFIHSSKGVFLMESKSKNHRLYSFPKISKSLDFHFEADGFNSETYNVDVVGKSTFSLFNAKIFYPEYLGLENKVIENAGDFLVPEGSRIEWNIKTKNAKSLNVRTIDSLYQFKESGVNFNRMFKRSEIVDFVLYSNSLNKENKATFKIDVIKDAFPSIVVKELKDSVKLNSVDFTGKVSDDIGLRSLEFVYKIERKGSADIIKRTSLPGLGNTEGVIDMSFDFSKLSLLPNDNVTYYFEVKDNDRLNGYKSVKSKIFSLDVPSVKEMKEERKDELNNAELELNDAIKEAEEFRKSVNDLKKNLLDNRTKKWNKQKQLSAVKEKQKSLEERLKDIKKAMNKSLEKQEQFSQEDLELLQKQEDIQKLMEELMDDELKDLLDELEKMLEKNQTNGQKELSEEIEKDSEEMEKNLDRTLEQLKQLKVNEALNDIEESLEKLAEEQEKLADKEISKEEELKEQDRIEEEFKELEKDLENTLDDNKDLQRPMDIDALEEDREEVKEEINDAKENIEKENKSKSQKSQKSSSQQMKEMAAKLNGMQMQSQEEQQGEDMELIRSILESLVKLSLSQEDNMHQFEKISTSDPNYVSVGRDQRKIIDDAQPIKDSLNELSKRVPKVAKFIDKELRSIDLNYNEALEDIDERRKSQLVVSQQYVMTSYNNLALFLNESLQQMQQQMQSQQSGSGSCSKPGGQGKGKSGEQSMEGLKESLKKQLESLKKGNSPGGKKPGDKEGKGAMGLGPKGAAQMAAEQSEMRRRLEELKNNLNKDGKGTGDLLNPILEELKEQQESLVNREWNSELINRQQEILTRLLESEKAIKERGFDDKRESNAGKNEENGNPIDFLEYKKLKEKQIELLRSLNPELDRYYKDRASEYFNRVN